MIMGIDSIERGREDAKKLDEKRADNAKESQKHQQGRNVGAQFQSMLQAKDKELNKERDKELKDQQTGNKEEGEEGLLDKIVQSLRGQNQSNDHMSSKSKEDKELDKLKEDEDDKEISEEDNKENPVEKKQSDKVHFKAEQEHDQDDGESGQQGSGRDRDGDEGDGGREQGGEQEGSFGGGFDHQYSAPKKGKPKKVFTIREIERNVFSRPVSSKQDHGGLTENLLDEIVENIQLGFKHQKVDSMKIDLSEDVFDGLSFSLESSREGMILTFICPSRTIRDTFVLQRSRIYAALRKKKIKVARIDIK